MAVGLAEKPPAVFNSSHLHVSCAEIDPPHTGEGDRGGAHGAWLQRDVQVAIANALAAPRRTGRANGDDLGMGRRVVPFHGAIAAFADHRAGGIGDDTAHRHFARRRRLLGKLERPAHGVWQFGFHHGR